MTHDPYVLFGVSQSATKAEIHSAYRRLVKVWHPDRHGQSAESQRRFREVSEAYDFLLNAEARAKAIPDTPIWTAAPTASAVPRAPNPQMKRPESAERRERANRPEKRSAGPLDDLVSDLLRDIDDIMMSAADILSFSRPSRKRT